MAPAPERALTCRPDAGTHVKRDLILERAEERENVETPVHKLVRFIKDIISRHNFNLRLVFKRLYMFVITWNISNM